MSNHRVYDVMLHENFEGWEIRHLFKRSKLFGLSKAVQNILSSCGWKLSSGGKLTKEEGDALDNALYRLASIPNLKKTCTRKNCKVCSKIAKLVSEEVKLRKPWRLDLELWRWQKECSDSWWRNGCQGIVKVVTGAGKTVLALSLVENLKNKEIYSNGGLKIVIVVPTTAVLDQWYGEVIERLSVPKRDIGLFYGEQKDDIRDKEIIICVINSARKHLKEILSRINDDVFFIADECHRFASSRNSKIFETNFDYKLGLSATPERKLDYGFEKVLVPNLGNVIYHYSYSDALADGIIPPYLLKRVEVPLYGKEEKAYDELSEKLRKLTQRIKSKYKELKNAEGEEFFKKLGELAKEHENKDLESYTLLANKRKAVVHESRSKIAALKYLIQNDIPRNSRILVFHERTDIADEIWNYLKEHGINASRYHSNMDSGERRKNLLKYKRGKVDVLVCCRALDEGLDVPFTNIGIIVAATSSIRQRIQRIGRILRRAPGKDYSIIYTIYVTKVEEKIFYKTEMRDVETSAVRVENIKMKFG